MLSLIDVTSGYGKTPVLKNISLDIHGGETLALIGLNGSGKSTLLKTALGLITPLSGKVLLNDKILHTMGLFERSQYISLLEATSQIGFSISVYELLKIAARVKNANEAIIDEVLTCVGLETFKNKNCAELSSGELRRAFIAHTLATQAEMIMIDEPFSHLDWNHQQRLFEGLKNWQKKYSTTFVLAVHELEWVVKLAQRVVALHKGQIIAYGKPEDVFNSKPLGEVFAFQSRIDENPLDGSRRLTLGKK